MEKGFLLFRTCWALCMGISVFGILCVLVFWGYCYFMLSVPVQLIALEDPWNEQDFESRGMLSNCSLTHSLSWLRVLCYCCHVSIWKSVTVLLILSALFIAVMKAVYCGIRWPHLSPGVVRVGLICFQAGCRTRQPNLAFVFYVYFLL